MVLQICFLYYILVVVITNKFFERMKIMEKSSKLLKIAGILMIIIGSIALLLSFLAVACSALISNAAGAIGDADINAAANMLMIASILMLAGAVIQFVAGIVGVANHNKPAKANVCIVFGVLVVLIYAVNIVLNITSGAEAFTLIVSLVAGLVIPLLYLIGAFQLKKLA